MKTRTQTIFLFLMAVSLLHGRANVYGQQTQSTELPIYFKVGNSIVDTNYMDNQATLNRLSKILTQDNTQYIESIAISGYSSPDGGSTINEHWATERAISFKQYLIKNYPHLQFSNITASGEGVNWKKLRELVIADKQLPDREKILYIIDNVPAKPNYKISTSRRKSLMDLGKRTWRYLLDNQFPLLRVGASMIVTLLPDSPQEVQDAVRKLSHITPEIVTAAISANVSDAEKIVITAQLDSLNTLLSHIDSIVEPTPQNDMERIDQLIKRAETQIKLTNDLKDHNTDPEIDRELEVINNQLRDIHRRLLAIREKLLNKTPIEEDTIATHNTPLVAKPHKKSRLALKTNLLYGAYAFTPNLGMEIGIGRRTTLDISGGYNWFNLNGAKNNNKKRVHWLIQPEFRYFLQERFKGHFLGVHALYSQYNIGGHNMPMFFGKGSKDYRHEGWAAGAGVSYGYQLALGRSWNVEFNIGVGYAQLKYDKYNCTNCGKEVSSETKHYFGPTKAGVSLIWMIK